MFVFHHYDADFIKVIVAKRDVPSTCLNPYVTDAHATGCFFHTFTPRPVLHFLPFSLAHIAAHVY